jgi:hypothetical protein
VGVPRLGQSAPYCTLKKVLAELAWDSRNARLTVVRP